MAELPAPRPAPGKSLYLPDFCTSRAALLLILIVELTAFVLTLARQNLAVDFWTDLTRTSLFLLWIGLTGTTLLCLTELFPREPGKFLLGNISIGLVITALALRYFFVTHEWRRNIEMQATARVHALQARIRPHFLFNSMNTIAALTRSNPALAEQAVQDLADLFRANLNEQRNILLLEEEIEVAHIYQRIEELRLGERLRVDWKVEALPRDALVPGLLLQPLLENAIYHGIEPRP